MWNWNKEENKQASTSTAVTKNLIKTLSASSSNKLTLPEFNLRNHYQLLKENHPYYQ